MWSPTCLGCKAKDITICLVPPTHLLNCWWLQICFVVWQVSFLVTSEGCPCTGMDTTSWIHGTYMSKRDFSIWWSVCDSMGGVQFCGMRHMLVLETIVNGDRHITNMSSVHYHRFIQQEKATTHTFAFSFKDVGCWMWNTTNGSGNNLLNLEMFIGHLNHQTWILLNIFGTRCNVLFKRSPPFTLLYICGLLCRIHSVMCLDCQQNTFRY